MPTLMNDTNLLWGHYRGLALKHQRKFSFETIMLLVVVSKGKVVGVIREQDLFFEIEKILRG